MPNTIKVLNKNLTHGKDTSPGQVRVMQFLRIHDCISTKELAYILNIKVPSLNELLNKLENKGLLYKEISPNDKRVLIIKLTENGKNFKFNYPKNVDIFDCLDESERETFEKSLVKLNRELFKRIEEENPEKFEAIKTKRNEVYDKYFKNHDLVFEDMFEEDK